MFGQDSENITHKERKFVPIIGTGIEFSNYYHNINSNQVIVLNKYQFSGGIQLNNRMDVAVNLGFLNTRYTNDKQVKKLEAIPLSLILQYSLINKKWFSLSLRNDIGVMLFSNVKGKFLNHRFEITPTEYYGYKYEPTQNKLFHKWASIVSKQVIISFKINNLYLDIGGGMNMLNFQQGKSTSTKKSTDSVLGINLYSGMRYTLGKTK